MENEDQKVKMENSTNPDSETPEMELVGDAGKDSVDEIEQAHQKEMLYLRAEFDNYKKRILKEQEQAVKFGNERIIRETLSVVDLLERALQHSANLKAQGGDAASFVSGIEMTHREFLQLLKRFGVEFIGSVGEKFDPSRHEAISQKEASEDKQGTILEVLQRGSLLNSRLLRPAQVVVAEGKAS